MGLMQEVLDRIENEAVKASEAAIRCTTMINEAEAIRDQLRAAGLTDANATFLPLEPHSYVIFYLPCLPPARVRSALRDAGLEIELETPHSGDSVEIKLAGRASLIWIASEPALSVAA